MTRLSATGRKCGCCNVNELLEQDLPGRHPASIAVCVDCDLGPADPIYTFNTDIQRRLDRYAGPATLPAGFTRTCYTCANPLTVADRGNTCRQCRQEGRTE
jgi:hypothetical protein